MRSFSQGEHLVASYVSAFKKDLVENCSSCADFTPRKIEQLLTSEFPELNKLIIADYFSRFIEIAKLDDLSVGTIIKHTKSIFSQHGYPEVVRADCGTQFNCSQFKQLAQECNFRLIT
ncbi:hypothetical protein PR048_010901 [Dryococelus australis]|uniref:Integrase catalytic domain-containing protein n=1 Tax=Dryococelus australis TaxID=614101 RepID=A0ABQ9I524_9NEOP|nr:hypothetical protein PR048_010901 [Dryococelus australis]